MPWGGIGWHLDPEFTSLCTLLARKHARVLFVWKTSHWRTRVLQSKGVEVVLITPNNGLFFPAIDYLYREIMQLRKQNKSYARIPLVINCAHFKGLDYTAAKGLELISSEIHSKNQRFVVLNASDKMRYVCRKSGCKSLVFCNSLDALSTTILSEYDLYGPRRPDGFLFFVKHLVNRKKHSRFRCYRRPLLLLLLLFL